MASGQTRLAPDARQRRFGWQDQSRVDYLCLGYESDSYPSAAGQATSPAGTGSPFADVGGAASPAALLSYSGPVSIDPVSITFGQHVGANAALRTGTYAKTLTFTLSTTQP